MLRETAGMPEMGSARDELLVEARHLTVENGGLSRPATLQIVETSIASSGVRGGRMSGSHPASIFVTIVSSPFSSPSAHSRGFRCICESAYIGRPWRAIRKIPQSEAESRGNALRCSQYLG